jgi:pimeloyl-ACP methyl ester carboxylesterase
MHALTIDTSHGNLKLSLSGYTNSGTGPVLLCLHGIQGGAATLGPLLSQPLFNSYKVIALDLVGFGDSSKPDNFSYSLEDQSQVLLQALSDIGASSFHLLGHSLGGMVGTLMLEHSPDRVLSFTNLEGNLTLADCGDSRKVAEMPFLEFENDFYPGLKRRQLEKGREHLAKSMGKTPAKVFYETAREIVEVSRSERLLRSLQLSSRPVLFLIGTAGAFSSRPIGDKITLCEIDGADHFALSRTMASYLAIKKFIDSVYGDGRTDDKQLT